MSSAKIFTIKPYTSLASSMCKFSIILSSVINQKLPGTLKCTKSCTTCAQQEDIASPVVQTSSQDSSYNSRCPVFGHVNICHRDRFV